MSRYIIRVHDQFNGMKLYQRLVCQISRLPPLRDACNDMVMEYGRCGCARGPETARRERSGLRPDGYIQRNSPPRVTSYTHTLLWSSFKCAAGISASSNADASFQKVVVL